LARAGGYNSTRSGSSLNTKQPLESFTEIDYVNIRHKENVTVITSVICQLTTDH